MVLGLGGQYAFEGGGENVPSAHLLAVEGGREEKSFPLEQFADGPFLCIHRVLCRQPVK